MGKTAHTEQSEKFTTLDVRAWADAHTTQPQHEDDAWVIGCCAHDEGDGDPQFCVVLSTVSLLKRSSIVPDKQLQVNMDGMFKITVNTEFPCILLGFTDPSKVGDYTNCY
eukprot:TRINITY_DN146_c0_g1_i4.p1 TRINITY_DN146_c0_g1~~TRINITY_DN146_c0_g1_i4.p1  ORF type:complete len:110 (-),score=21.97 TRINITY_DN146_c0_g1_i4:1258-1587(-)